LIHQIKRRVLLVALHTLAMNSHRSIRWWTAVSGTWG
jgi:hypothetical protein